MKKRYFTAVIELPDDPAAAKGVMQALPLFGVFNGGTVTAVYAGDAISAYSTPKPPHISVQTLPAIPAETGHPLHPKPYHPFQSKVGHPFQSKPAVQAG